MSFNHNETLIPVTIEHISNIQVNEGKYSLDKVDIKKISIIAKIVNYEVKVTKVDFVLSDDSTTKQLNAAIYLDEGQQYQYDDIKINTYVKIIGVVRMLEDKMTLLIFNLTKLKRPENDDQMEYELYDARLRHLERTRGKLDSNGNIIPINSNSNNSKNNNNNNNSNNNNSNNNKNNKNEPKSDNINDSVLKILNNDKSTDGLTTKDIHKVLIKYSKIEITKAIEYLLDESIIYSSIDDDHYKSCCAD